MSHLHVSKFIYSTVNQIEVVTWRILTSVAVLTHWTDFFLIFRCYRPEFGWNCKIEAFEGNRGKRSNTFRIA